MSDSGTRALHDLRRARRRRAYGEIDWMDAIYRVYVTAILSTVAVAILSSVVGGKPVTLAGLAAVVERGPALLGLVVAVAVAAGLRSGGRGGPLVLQPADVAHVLLAPVSRTVALRRPAVQQLRFSGFAGALVGMVAGNLAVRRLPGQYWAWVGAGGLAGAIAGLAFIGAAMLASGRRLGRGTATAAGALVVGWSVGDLAARSATSPATFLGRLAMAPLDGLPAPAIGALLLMLPLAGLVVVGGTSLEAARRQAGLQAQLRFAVTMQDVRTVILLRRQLAAEAPRRRPWVRLPPGFGARHPVWRRDWQAILRWPAARVARMATLGAAAGVAAAASFRGTPVLILLAGLALLVAALDAVEGLAQEADHPDRSRTVPVSYGRLTVRHLAAPFALMLPVVAIATAVAAILGRGSPLTVVAVGAIVAAPAALAAVSAAALSVDSPPGGMSFEPFATVRMVARVLGPPVLAVIGVAPALDAQLAVDSGRSPIAGAVPSAVATFLLATMVARLLGRRR